jgi:hypothetical protein
VRHKIGRSPNSRRVEVAMGWMDGNVAFVTGAARGQGSRLK